MTSLARRLLVVAALGPAHGGDLAALPAIASGILPLARSSPARQPGDPARRPPVCGAATAWDRDGDTISDSIELNNRDAGYHDFDPDRCDRDPSRARGLWFDGRLRGGINLTDRGTGYSHFLGTDPVDGDDWATLALLNCLEAAGRRQRGGRSELSVLDLSLRRGGPFFPHRSHQNGLDADLRYLRKDRRAAPLDLSFTPDDHAVKATRRLFRILIRKCDVNVIFVDLPRLGFGNEDLPRRVLVDAPGHSNHFHLRLDKPERSGGRR